jgi:hypothetical protein
MVLYFRPKGVALFFLRDHFPAHIVKQHSRQYNALVRGWVKAQKATSEIIRAGNMEMVFSRGPVGFG